MSCQSAHAHDCDGVVLEVGDYVAIAGRAETGRIVEINPERTKCLRIQVDLEVFDAEPADVSLIATVEDYDAGLE